MSAAAEPRLACRPEIDKDIKDIVMASTNGAACKSCRFFDDHKTNGGTAAGEEGLCRFNPPVSQPEPKGHGLWPVVDAQDWCGHFTAGSVSPAE